MQRYRTKDPARQRQYQVMIDMAKDPKSSLYNADGSHNRGASHRAAFWNGYEYGEKFPHLIPGSTSLVYCVWRAGVDFKTFTQTGEIQK